MDLLKKMKRVAILAAVGVSAVNFAYGQDRCINLWPNGAPGAKVAEGYQPSVEPDGSWMTKVVNPSLEFYFPKDDRTARSMVVICPGGGYAGIAIKHEGADVARWLNSKGVAAVVLKYRMPSDLIMEDRSIGPLQDVQEAVRYVRRNAKELNVNPSKIGVMGFSAGGHLAASAATHYADAVYASDSISARPDFSILIYPVISMDSSITHMGSRENLIGQHPSAQQVVRFSNELQVNSKTPPAFIVHSMDDKTVDVDNSIRYAKALNSQGVHCELHLYQKGGHGYGLGRSEGSESFWHEPCEHWLRMNRILR